MVVEVVVVVRWQPLLEVVVEVVERTTITVTGGQTTLLTITRRRNRMQYLRNLLRLVLSVTVMVMVREIPSQVNQKLHVKQMVRSRNQLLINIIRIVLVQVVVVVRMLQLGIIYEVIVHRIRIYLVMRKNGNVKNINFLDQHRMLILENKKI